MHYKRWRKHGDPALRIKRPDNMTRDEALDYHGWIVTESGCWEWERRNPANYGLVWYDGKDNLAHRAMYKRFFGPIPEGMFVCHSCDNPPCVNPEHLWLGTPLDNVLDKEHKGRGNQAKGESNGYAKLTEENVIEIRRLREDGLILRVIAEQFGITEAAVSSIARRKTWAHV